MLERLIEFTRGRAADREKAHAYIAAHAAESFRELLADYNAFVPHVSRVAEPALLLGSARDSADAEVPVRLPWEEIFCHWLVQGGTGTGKTTFATWLVSNALREGQAIGVLDCKSGFFDAGVLWAGATAYGMPAEHREAFVKRLAIVNPFGEALVPLNVCKPLAGGSAETQAYEVALALSRLFDSSMGFQMENILRHLILLLMESGLTLAEAPALLEDEVLRGVLATRSRNTALKDFFLGTYPGVPASSKDAISVRLQALLLPENLRLMLGADDLVDLKGILDRGDPLFLFLGKGPGVPEEQVEVVGSLLLQLLFQAAFAGGSRTRPYQLVCDEFFHLLDAPALAKRFETALTTLRSFGVTLSLVMHNFSQVPGSLRETLLGNCDLMALFRTSSRNAQFFGEFLPELDPESALQALRKSGRPPGRFEAKSLQIERLQRLPNRHCYWYDRRKPYRALLLRVPDVPAPHEAVGVSSRVLDDFIEARGIRRGSVALPKDALRRQIEARRARLRELIRPPIDVSTHVEEQAAPAGPPAGAKERERRPRLG